MTIELALGGGFVVGAIFWAGATYQRISGIEVTLGAIKTKFDVVEQLVAELRVLQQTIVEHERRIGKLEER